MLANIRIVLVNTSHPGNIGAAARAMKTMGLSSLYLVEPKVFPSEEATFRASGADDVLDSTVVCDSLQDALNGCDWVVGTTARERSLSAKIFHPRECAEQALPMAGDGKTVALVFGRERSGLTNEELDLCQALIHIPANKEYSSLNLGAAVQVLSYEMRMASLSLTDSSLPTEQVEEKHSLDNSANFNEIDGFYGHLESVLLDIQFIREANSVTIMRRLRNLYDRAELSLREVNILRGMLSAIEKQSRTEK